MKRVVGVSLGSSKRDSVSREQILGTEFEISRIGTDGDMDRFVELMRELDGKVDAIGLGGIDRYYWIGDKRYTVRDADRLAKVAKVTPVVDGSGVKNTLERKTIQFLQESGTVDFSKKRVLLVAAVDRFGMAQSFDGLAGQIVYGDLIFTMGIPIPMRSYRTVSILGAILLPIIVKMPFKWFYPTGAKQEKSAPKYQNYYEWADVIAGDWHLIKKNLPSVESGLLKGKIVVTNTITDEDEKMLRARDLGLLVTSTPKYGNRRFGTNVLEGVLVNLIGKSPEDLRSQDYEDLLERMNWQPSLTRLDELSGLNKG